MTAARYSLPAMILHWVQAALVIWLLWRGWTMIDLPKGAERTAAYALHKSLGLVALALVVIRLGWRRMNRPPAISVGGWEAALASLTHRALYVFLLVAPLAGYFASSFSTYPLKFFGIEVPKVGWPDESINALFKWTHIVFTWGGAALVFLHVVGAFKHGLGRDGVLQRMLPARLFRN